MVRQHMGFLALASSLAFSTVADDVKQDQDEDGVGWPPHGVPEKGVSLGLSLAYFPWHVLVQLGCAREGSIPRQPLRLQYVGAEDSLELKGRFDLLAKLVLESPLGKRWDGVEVLINGYNLDADCPKFGEELKLNITCQRGLYREEWLKPRPDLVLLYAPGLHADVGFWCSSLRSILSAGVPTAILTSGITDKSFEMVPEFRHTNCKYRCDCAGTANEGAKFNLTERGGFKCPWREVKDSRVVAMLGAESLVWLSHNPHAFHVDDANEIETLSASYFFVVKGTARSAQANCTAIHEHISLVCPLAQHLHLSRKLGKKKAEESAKRLSARLLAGKTLQPGFHLDLFKMFRAKWLAFDAYLTSPDSLPDPTTLGITAFQSREYDDWGSGLEPARYPITDGGNEL